jgi:hypothetical protein
VVTDGKLNVTRLDHDAGRVVATREMTDRGRFGNLVFVLDGPAHYGCDGRLT